MVCIHGSDERQGSQIVTVTADDHTFQLDIDGQTVATVAPHQRPGDPPLQGLRHPAAMPSALMAERG